MGMSIRKSIAQFGSDQRGVIAMLFAIVLVPVMLTIGLALDYGHASGYERQMQRVMDEAVIAGASAMAKSSDGAKAQAVAERRFNATKPKRYPIQLKFTAEPERGRIRGEALASVPMTFMALAGFTKLDVTASAIASAKPSRQGKQRPRKPVPKIDERQISDVIRQVESMCYRLRQMNFADHVPQCGAVFDGTFADRLRAQLASSGNAGRLLPAGVRLVQ